jgi:DNA-binding protein
MLEESDVITAAQALKVIDSVIELSREADSSGLARRGRQVRSATAIIETIRSRFDAKTKP